LLKVEHVVTDEVDKHAAFDGAEPITKAEEAAAATTKPAMESFLVIGEEVFSGNERTDQQPQTMAISVYPKEAALAQQPC
jgi:hypothetical protein